MLTRRLITSTLIASFALVTLSCSSSPDPNAQNAPKDPAANIVSSPTPANTVSSAPMPDVISSADGMIALQPSDISEVLETYRKEHPELSTKEIAEYGNSLLSAKGYNYWIDVADLVEKKEKRKEVKIISEENYSFSLEMTLVSGPKQKFIIMSPRSDSCCCGYKYANFPVVKITDKTITLVADGKQFEVKRPKELARSEVYALVPERQMSKEIYKWQVPFEGYPQGISEDGTKLYVGGPTEDIYQEISTDGTFKFVPKADVRSDKGDFCKKTDDAKNPDDAYESCRRFTVNDKTYFVRFSAPCT